MCFIHAACKCILNVDDDPLKNGVSKQVTSSDMVWLWYVLDGPLPPLTTGTPETSDVGWKAEGSSHLWTQHDAG